MVKIGFAEINTQVRADLSVKVGHVSLVNNVVDRNEQGLEAGISPYYNQKIVNSAVTVKGSTLRHRAGRVQIYTQHIPDPVFPRLKPPPLRPLAPYAGPVLVPRPPAAPVELKPRRYDGTNPPIYAHAGRVKAMGANNPTDEELLLIFSAALKNYH